MLKLLLQPFLFFIFISITTLIFLVVNKNKLLNQKAVQLIWINLISIIIIIVLSMPFTSSLFERSLYVKYLEQSLDPDVIVILGGGYLVNKIEEMDILTSSTRSRVIEGAKMWQLNQKSIIIMSGTEILNNRPLSKGVNLMKREAEMAGVPSNMIRLDSLSINTWDHAEKIINLNFIDSKMVVGIVTSRWHMRRAVQSFKRYFQSAIPLSLDSSFEKIKYNGIYNFIPNSQSISKTTLMLQEWIAIYWYKIKKLTSQN